MLAHDRRVYISGFQRQQVQERILMRSTVTVVFNPRQCLDFDVEVEPTPQSAQEAREWFDQTWLRLGCEPLRPSGKVLLLDKILGVADALGHTLLAQDAQQAQEYAERTALALDKPRVKVDLPGMVVAF
jgi:hypothetical protein